MSCSPPNSAQASLTAPCSGGLAPPRMSKASLVYLASDDSAYATGGIFTVDGGLTVK
ncbi:hypothetical protein [Paenarthrobacter nicotinovorans]|uniref:hypothetical protein n=1 Tax=Paenarthrobacter nicotinovorans TaxID=29320 RepID=UPI00164239DB|nr:hypothetical protein [Paenarthrobacter nicotinovorans]